jgi:hypothetical protein
MRGQICEEMNYCPCHEKTIRINKASSIFLGTSSGFPLQSQLTVVYTRSLKLATKCMLLFYNARRSCRRLVCTTEQRLCKSEGLHSVNSYALCHFLTEFIHPVNS